MQQFKTDCIELQKMMVEKGIKTIAELSRKSGVNRNTCAQVVNGDITPSTDVMYKIAGALDMNSFQAGKIFFAKNLRSA